MHGFMRTLAQKVFQVNTDLFEKLINTPQVDCDIFLSSGKG